MRCLLLGWWGFWQIPCVSALQNCERWGQHAQTSSGLWGSHATSAGIRPSSLLCIFIHVFFLLLAWWEINCLFVNPYTASCENAMTLSVPGVPASCEKFPHSSQLNFWSTESIFNQFSVFVKTLNALCNINTSGQWKESLGQTSQSLCSCFSGRTNATPALSLGVA
jgi:hypothetical protein